MVHGCALPLSPPACSLAFMLCPCPSSLAVTERGSHAVLLWGCLAYFSVEEATIYITIYNSYLFYHESPHNCTLIKPQYRYVHSQFHTYAWTHTNSYLKKHTHMVPIWVNIVCLCMCVCVYVYVFCEAHNIWLCTQHMDDAACKVFNKKVISLYSRYRLCRMVAHTYNMWSYFLVHTLTVKANTYG